MDFGGFMAFFLLNLFDYVDYHAAWLALFACTMLELSLIYNTENMIYQRLVQLIAFIYSILHKTAYASVF